MKSKKPGFVRASDIRPAPVRLLRARQRVPYGFCVTPIEDGRWIVFNRSYKPIWQVLPTGVGEPADPNEIMEGEQHFFLREGLITGWQLEYWNFLIALLMFLTGDEQYLDLGDPRLDALFDGE